MEPKVTSLTAFSCYPASFTSGVEHRKYMLSAFENGDDDFCFVLWSTHINFSLGSFSRCWYWNGFWGLNSNPILTQRLCVLTSNCRRLVRSINPPTPPSAPYRIAPLHQSLYLTIPTRRSNPTSTYPDFLLDRSKPSPHFLLVPPYILYLTCVVSAP